MSLERMGKYFLQIGSVLVVSALLLFGVIFFPILWEEARYELSQPPVDARIVLDTEESEENSLDTGDVIVPASNDFSIIIPKIGGNAPIVSDVDPYNEDVYRNALRTGIAHAKDTARPSEKGTGFYFAHSSDNFYEANRYNTVFYLLHKLEAGDSITIIEKGERHDYAVSDMRIVTPESVEYLTETSHNDTIRLMTCWPPGTTQNRLLVTATKKDK